MRQFLAADLIDFMHVAVVPITLGRGSSLFAGLEGIESGLDMESVTFSGGLTHQLWNRKS